MADYQTATTDEGMDRTEQLLGELAPGEMLEVDPEHAEAMGAFEDDALSEDDALESAAEDDGEAV